MVMKQTLKILKQRYHQQPETLENNDQETRNASKSSETEHLYEFENMICDPSDND